MAFSEPDRLRYALAAAQERLNVRRQRAGEEDNAAKRKDSAQIADRRADEENQSAEEE